MNDYIIDKFVDYIPKRVVQEFGAWEEMLTALSELKRLAKIGEATELAYDNKYAFTFENDYGDIIDSLTREELLNYVKE